MQLSSLLFVQLPALLANLTNPTGTEYSSVTSSTFEMSAPTSYILPKLPYEYNVRSPSPRLFFRDEAGMLIGLVENAGARTSHFGANNEAPSLQAPPDLRQ